MNAQVSNIKVEIDGLVCEVPAPYCSPAEWARRVGISENDVKNHLHKGLISKYQLVPKGRMYVNVVQELRRTLSATQEKPWV